jgi:Na+/H+ antiporter NhaD/arsenite permease-like protein
VVTALLAATVMLVWLRPMWKDVKPGIDDTRFFMALFMLVGAIQEVGLMGAIASAMGESSAPAY